MKDILKITTYREIRNSLGRYLAILAIVALGVGFFAGLRVTKQAMISTANDYLKAHNMFDYELISTLGYDETSLKAVQSSDAVRDAEGSITYDILASMPESGDDAVIKVISTPKKINTLKLYAGRLPEHPDECVVDSTHFPESTIGKYIELSGNNDYVDTSNFAYEKYKIVGTAASPLYLNFERGTASVGDGAVDAFMYIDREGFDKPDVFTEIYVKLDNDYDYFSKASDEAIADAESELKEIAENASSVRYDTILDDLGEQYSIISILAGLPLSDFAGLYGFHKGDTYVLDSGTNVGYATFEENANIVSSIAKVFPLFFFLVAAMVCMTTMTRMIDEQRTQIGVLKALGYTGKDVLYKYMFYSGSATGIGAILGFVVGSWIFPLVIWKAYGMIYNFESHINYVMNLPLLFVSLIASFVCTLGSTWLSCSQEFKEVPAELIRPKAPKAGKRIFLEHIPLIWSRLSFLYKVSMRNIFRYKKRLFMMVMGISGCTALLIAGFGIDTTISDVAKYQYSEITKYDYQVTFSEDMTEPLRRNFEKYLGDRYEDIMFVQSKSVDIKAGGTAAAETSGTAAETSGTAAAETADTAAAENGAAAETSDKGAAETAGKSGGRKSKTRQVNLIVSDGKDMPKYMDLHDGDTSLEYPGDGEAIVCRKINKQLGVDVGDTITLTKDHEDFSVRVSGICDNYVSDFVYVNMKTYEDGLGDKPELKTAYVVTGSDDAEYIRSSASHAARYPLSAAYSVNVDTIDRVEQMMKSLNSVVILVIVSAGLLAFVVLYNLTNINITERIREIATIKVLGFYPKETSQYVFRENIFLTAMSAVVGIPMGRWLLEFVISRIVIDTIFFVSRITLMDYLRAIVLTFVFAFVVNIAMRRRLESISMTESLKSIE